MNENGDCPRRSNERDETFKSILLFTSSETLSILDFNCGLQIQFQTAEMPRLLGFSLNFEVRGKVNNSWCYRIVTVMQTITMRMLRE